MMDYKKQLVTIPPFSEALQKLNEVLKSISDEESIELSTIDDQKELNQFIGSAGQSLFLFSNAKKCALFLQENRFIIAKAHSKVILLTPKEIPAKTLTKFIKLGLTEAILESSPPKTLLYKVKLLVRSIKSTSINQEEKDQVVKSMLDLNAMSALKREALSETDHEATGALSEENKPEAKKKNETELELQEAAETARPKKAYTESPIETNWKTKKKAETELFDLYGNNSKVASSDDGNIDIYYRGKKKINETAEIEISPAASKEKLAGQNEEETSAAYPKKELKETVLDLHRERKEKSDDETTHEEKDYMELKESNDISLDLGKSPLGPEENAIDAEDKARTKKKEFDELEALFEAAHAKAAEEKQNQDLGGHMLGKIKGEVTLDIDPNEQSDQGPQYDQADLYERKKKETEMELAPATPEQKKQSLEERLEILKKRKQALEERLQKEEEQKDGKVDKLTTLMISEIDNKKTKDLFETEEQNWMTKSRANEEQEDYSLDERREKKIHLEGSTDEITNDEKENEDYIRDDLDKDRKELTELELERASSDKDLNNEQEQKDESMGAKLERLMSLETDDDKKDLKKSDKDNESETMALKKVKNVELLFSEDDKKNLDGAKTEKIDTYYRSGESKRTDFSWDNLTGKGQSDFSSLFTRNEREETLDTGTVRRDLGEISIDYRKMKEEFDHIARHGSSSSSDPYGGRSKNLLDSDDEGTFKVIETNARGFLFSIEIVNLLYTKDPKPIDFYRKISEEMISSFHGHPVFYTYKTSDQSHTEAFNSFSRFDSKLVPDEVRAWWAQTKENKEMMADYFEKSMTTWICRDIPDAKAAQGFWQDVELPSWADQELIDKKVELVFPYFDGVDKMGLAVIYFPEGISASKEHSMLITLELLRAVMLETIQRTISVTKENKFVEEAPAESGPQEENKVTSLFKGLFGKNKAS